MKRRLNSRGRDTSRSWLWKRRRLSFSLNSGTTNSITGIVPGDCINCDGKSRVFVWGTNQDEPSPGASHHPHPLGDGLTTRFRTSLHQSSVKIPAYVTNDRS